MSERTAIEWCDSTFNPWTGCTKVSPACDHCYAESWAKRSGTVQWGPHAERRRTTAANWRQPLKWERDAAAFQAAHGRRQRVFCASLADVFDPKVPPEWRRDLFELIGRTAHLDWLLLTKRIGNARAMLNAVVDDLSCGINTWDERPWPGVWIGTTVVNQQEADRDIPKLLATPARVRFLSVEPMLGPINLRMLHHDGITNIDALAGRHGVVMPMRGECERIDWVIVGGESGPGARPMHPAWARSLRDQCAAAGVPFLFKQWGEWMELDSGPDPLILRMETNNARAAAAKCDGFINRAGTFVRYMDEAPDDEPYRGMVRIGKKAAGRMLDGREHNDFPKQGGTS